MPDPQEGAIAWAIFDREYNWSRPKSIYSFNAKPSPLPQSRVHDFVDAAVAAGAARRAPPPTAETTPKRRRRTNP